MKELKEALKKLNIKGKVGIKYVSTDRIAVYVDGEYFGIWDKLKKTFVD